MNHEKLICYQRLIKTAKKMPNLIRTLPSNCFRRDIEDQMVRAMNSAVLNLCEGNGRRSIKERNHFFTISTASIDEVQACVCLISAYGYIPVCLEMEINVELTRIAAMITKLRR